MDTAALQAVVTVLKEEIEHHKRQVRRLQRENRVLVRTVLQLQQQQQRGLLHGGRPEQRGAGSSNGEEREGHDVSEAAPPQPSSTTSAVPHRCCLRCGAELPSLAGSPLQRGAAGSPGDHSPLPLEGRSFHEDGHTALQVRVRVLEKQLRCERQRRQAQAEEFTAELELLRFALDEAEQRPSRRQRRPTDDGAALRQESLPLSPTPGNGNGNGDGGGGDSTTESTPEYHEALSEAHADRDLFSCLAAPSGGPATPASLGPAEPAEAVAASGVPQCALPAATDVAVCGGEEPRNGSPQPGGATRHPSTRDTDCVAGGSPRRFLAAMGEDKLLSPTSQLETSRDVSTATDTPRCEDFLSRATSRMEGRRQRLRNAVMPRATVEASDVAGGEHRDPAISLGGRQPQLHAVPELPPNAEPLPSPSPSPPPSSPLTSLGRRGQRHLAHRRPASFHALHGDDAVAGHCKSTASTTSAAGGPLAVNPNQLGVEVDPKGPRNRTWYAHQVLRVAFTKFIHVPFSASSAGTPAATAAASTAITPNSFERVPEGSDMESFQEGNQQQQLPQQQRQRGGSLSDSQYSSLETSGTFDSEEELEDHTEVGASGPADAPLQPPPISSGMYRSIPSSAIRRAIDETAHLRFRCCQNQPLLETVAEPFPSVLPPFHAENTDSELVANFAMDAASPSSYREDEIGLTLHSPVLFSQIRSFLGMDAEGFRASLGENAVWRQTISPGKSGTTLIFFGNFVMKSLKKGEFKFLLGRFLSSYVSFCERHPSTLLPRFYALLTFSWLRLRTCKRYVLMQNVFSTRYYIHRIYDVKGSTVGRSTTTETAPRTSFGALLLKDNDLPAQLIICGPLQRAHVLAQLRSDVGFLHSLNVVDYSCLIGVRSRVFSRKEGPSKTILLKERRGTYWQQTCTSEAIGVGTEQLQKTDNSCIRSCDGGLLSLPIYAAGDDTTAREDVYYLGIIDVLQEYTSAKRFESFAKGLWSDRRQISVVPPKEYAERLYQVLENVTV
ncbi:putative phosphatidylinositol-4-phosphate 5-kinase-like [Trypanosoma conorhini]|uniref:Putative phosphatidylinositol-4-phosphate 5-kinase-like n=1 Tax=Trypanosoma conorhini TaxID=83891 RepID=A0A3R7P0F6_9TRYP|nr:putative phosphatidylinositol-4-phosphate 5-kinase-like [Trypanosoma conorhini]RNF26811.1 putative phosphatidylinositol-4-phosphate 5-kinase-like [Trypanosoma conorhini]